MIDEPQGQSLGLPGSKTAILRLPLVAAACGGSRDVRPSEAIGSVAGVDQGGLPGGEVDGGHLVANVAGDVGDFTVGLDEDLLRLGRYVDGADDREVGEIDDCDFGDF